MLVYLMSGRNKRACGLRVKQHFPFAYVGQDRNREKLIRTDSELNGKFLVELSDKVCLQSKFMYNVDSYLGKQVLKGDDEDDMDITIVFIPYNKDLFEQKVDGVGIFNYKRSFNDFKSIPPDAKIELEKVIKVYEDDLKNKHRSLFNILKERWEGRTFLTDEQENKDVLKTKIEAIEKYSQDDSFKNLHLKEYLKYLKYFNDSPIGGNALNQSFLVFSDL